MYLLRARQSDKAMGECSIFVCVCVCRYADDVRYISLVFGHRADPFSHEQYVWECVQRFYVCVCVCARRWSLQKHLMRPLSTARGAIWCEPMQRRRRRAFNEKYYYLR